MEDQTWGPPSSGIPSAVKPKPVAGLLQGGDVAGGAVAEAEVGADDDRGGVQAVDEHPA